MNILVIELKLVMYIQVFVVNRKKENGCILEEKTVQQEYGTWGKSFIWIKDNLFFRLKIITEWCNRSSSFQCQRIFQVTAPVNCVCLHPNQAELIVGDQSGVIHLWDLRSDHNEQLVCILFYIIIGISFPFTKSTTLTFLQ